MSCVAFLCVKQDKNSLFVFDFFEVDIFADRLVEDFFLAPLFRLGIFGV